MTGQRNSACAWQPYCTFSSGRHTVGLEHWGGLRISELSCLGSLAVDGPSARDEHGADLFPCFRSSEDIVGARHDRVKEELGETLIELTHPLVEAVKVCWSQARITPTTSRLGPWRLKGVRSAHELRTSQLVQKSANTVTESVWGETTWNSSSMHPPVNPP